MPTIINGTTGVDKVQTGAVTSASIPNGELPIAKLATTGTADNTTFLRGDNTWQTISTSPTTSQVLAATAGAEVGAVGTYAFLGQTSAASVAVGTNYAGSSLRYAGDVVQSTWSAINTNPAGVSTWRHQNVAPAGTWKCMGSGRGGLSSETNYFPATLFLRIS
jgi:hypothetical protein